MQAFYQKSASVCPHERIFMQITDMHLYMYIPKSVAAEAVSTRCQPSPHSSVAHRKSTTAPAPTAAPCRSAVSRDRAVATSTAADYVTSVNSAFAAAAAVEQVRAAG